MSQAAVWLVSPPAITVSDPLIGLSVGGYRIERVVGQGGMGLVYLAQHELIDRRFAIKVLRPEWAGDLSQRKSFLREAQTLSALKHPNIIEIVGFGPLPDGRMHMVMEYLDGDTLEHEMSAGRLTLARTLQVAEQILNALVAAHSVEVIHRDLKPSNVFLSHGSGGIEVIKLLDFGLAREQPVALGPTGSVAPGCSEVAGTPEYVSPEQAQGAAPDKASDLYSFGVMLFEMLTGKLPFEPGITVSNRGPKLLRAHSTELAPTPSFVGVEVPHALSVLLRELMHKSASMRPASAQAVRERICAVRHVLERSPPAEVLPGAPVRERPFTPPVALVPSARRGWGAPASMALGLCLGLVVLLGSGFGRAAPVDTTPPVRPPPPSAVVLTSPALAVLAPPLTAPPRRRVPPVVPALKAPRRNVLHSDCEPDDRWRAAARLHVQELQQLAAAESRRWAAFEKLEPALSGAIGAATTGAQCEASDQQIRKLALAWRK